MSEQAPIYLPVLFGPTASGKTALAVAAAERSPLPVEIISADSRQVYRHLDIGTAKPTPEQRRRACHHLIDLITPEQTYAAGEWSRSARSIATDLIERGVIPFVVGGAGFYIRALFDGLSAPPADPAIVARLDERLRDEGAEALYNELQRVDPEGAALHEPGNGARTVRALACWEQHGVPYSRWRGASDPFVWNGRPVLPQLLLLDPERPFLYARINHRVEEMMGEGLIEETERVLAMGYSPEAPGLRTVGYAEAVAHLRGALDLEGVVAAVAQATRRYAKRQVTWMRGQMGEGERIGPEDVAGLVERLERVSL